MRQCVEIVLDGTDKELAAIFSYNRESDPTKLSSLGDFIAHAFNESMVCDRCYGGWAQCLKQDDGRYVLKMYSPHHDLRPYAAKVAAFIAAGKTGLAIYKENEKKIQQAGKGKIRFLLPAGLSMIHTRSVQLLHFPPLETLVYKDYLYSPTNRRWENLLGYNGMTEAHFPEMETITDCVPLAAPGDDSQGIAPFNNTFTPYVKQMLQARLNHSKVRTQPVVAYGGPVRDWLKQAYPDQIKKNLQPLTLLELRLTDGKAVTPVLCANHPSQYLYLTDEKGKLKEKIKVMTQDLIAAGWQAYMAHHPKASAKATLAKMTARWKGNPRVLEIIRQEDEAYGYGL